MMIYLSYHKSKINQLTQACVKTYETIGLGQLFSINMILFHTECQLDTV